MPLALDSQQRSYLLLRALHISLVFAFTILVQKLWRYPNAGWTGFTVMMIYGGFDNGTAISRAYHRFIGMILGLYLGFILWFVGHMDYRTMYFLIPLTIAGIYFSAGTRYAISTLLTVSASLIGYGYFHSQSLLTISFFLFDYSMATVIGFCIILLFEFFWFKRYRMMHRFIKDTQTDVIRILDSLVVLINQDNIRRSDWFNTCIAMTGSLFEMDRLVLNAQFVNISEKAVGEEFNQFILLSHQIFVNLKAIYIASYTDKYKKFDYYQLVNRVTSDLNYIKTLLPKEEPMKSRVVHAASS